VISFDDIETPIEYLIKFDNGSNYLRYRYDAWDKKPQKVIKEGTAAEKTTDYVAGLAYEGNCFQFIPTSEGRILPPALADNGGAWAYEYSYKDHLENLRLSVRAGATPTKPRWRAADLLKATRRMFSNLTDAIRVSNGCLEEAVGSLAPTRWDPCTSSK